MEDVGGSGHTRIQDLTQDRFQEWSKRSGCPHCGVVVLRGVHLCEHGVTTPPTYEIHGTISFELTDKEYDKLRGEGSSSETSE